MVIFSYSLQVGVNFNSAFQGLLEIQFSLFLGNIEPMLLTFPTFTKGPVPGALWGSENGGASDFPLPLRNAMQPLLQPHCSSQSRLAPAYTHALALALPCLEAFGYLASPPPSPMVVHVSGIICTLDICFRVSLSIESSDIMLITSSQCTPPVWNGFWHEISTLSSLVG